MALFGLNIHMKLRHIDFKNILLTISLIQKFLS